MKQKKLNLTIDVELARVARHVSKKMPGCPRPTEGSEAHALKYALVQWLKQNGFKKEYLQQFGISF